MEDQRRTFDAFLRMHAHKASCTNEPRAHLAWITEGTKGDVPHNCCLFALEEDDVKEALDPSAELVRWLLHQMHTYDCTRQRIVGLVFDRKTVLSEVLRLPVNERPA